MALCSIGKYGTVAGDKYKVKGSSRGDKDTVRRITVK